ncbi:hypothetical protein MHM86_02740 [Thalassobius sp. Cn5-15]|nr:hypothetical protein [Thalassobius sp. Cn5-15]
MAREKINNKVSRLIYRLADSPGAFSKQTGVPVASINKWIFRGEVPARYAIVFAVECMAKGVTFPPGVFKMYRPLDERVARASKGKFKNAAGPAFAALGVEIPKDDA